MEEIKEQESNLGKDVLFLHAGCEVNGKIIRDSIEIYGSTKYLYQAIDIEGTKYSITKENFIKFL